MSTRDRILDAAATVLREQGIARATTKEIARAADCSEALLYKHFAGKHELFLGVLSERAPRLPQPDELVGTRMVRQNLETLVSRLVDFYVESFPMSASILGSPDLLTAHRAGLRRLGAGPTAPARQVQAYLDAEIALGRVDSGVDTHALARTVTGAALFEAFLAVYEGHSSVPDAEGRARGIVASVRL
ncbi:TetR/AcrR family transcriptional regulator [Ruania alba]|uniref:DNA-binding transcriptional regulator, AcrR family n=1 Tax=Ruania alba TaxID=648782 RepID=A0A1H5N819_9MICO|nr:TetR/AcrR family transcriptional regulator [Ruania alba]SEE97762.1 DNA-binding transcriptional regulator, AcrR family [Ruania alba]